MIPLLLKITPLFTLCTQLIQTNVYIKQLETCNKKQIYKKNNVCSEPTIYPITESFTLACLCARDILHVCIAVMLLRCTYKSSSADRKDREGRTRRTRHRTASRQLFATRKWTFNNRYCLVACWCKNLSNKLVHSTSLYCERVWTAGPASYSSPTPGRLDPDSRGRTPARPERPHQTLKLTFDWGKE